MKLKTFFLKSLTRNLLYFISANTVFNRIIIENLKEIFLAWVIKFFPVSRRSHRCRGTNTWRLCRRSWADSRWWQRRQGCSSRRTFQCHQLGWAFASARILGKGTGLVMLPGASACRVSAGLRPGLLLLPGSLARTGLLLWCHSATPLLHLLLLPPLKLLFLLPLHLQLLAGLPARLK